MQTIPQRSTLVQQVAEILRQGIRDNVWSDYLPAEMELCRKFQVSRVTLRTALEILTQEGLVSSSQGQRRRVSPRQSAAPAAILNRLVVMLTEVALEQMGSVSVLMVDNLRAQLAKDGFELEIYSNPACFTRRPENALETFVREKSAAVWVLLRSTKPMQCWFTDRKLPCLLIGTPHPGIALPFVGTDYFALGQHAAWQFLRRGHHRLAVLMPMRPKAGDTLTVTGFRKACSQVEGAQMLEIQHDGSPMGIRRSLALMTRKSAPTGLLVAIPYYALTAVAHLVAMGLKNPGQVSVIARDSETFLDFMVPSVARYVIDTQSFSRKVARVVRVLEKGGKVPPRGELLFPDFVAGETLGRLSENNTGR